MLLEELRTAYRSTWLEWARQTDALQYIVESGSPDRGQVEKLLLAAECARAAHNQARDRLALAFGQAPAPLGEPAPRDGRVRETAHLLWEFAGRPDGTAESDWQRAQSVVRTVGAGCCD
jgi:hypothetical protein